MQISDVIADMLTRIRNANDAKHETVDIPASNMKKAIAKILLDEGYIKSYESIEDGKLFHFHENPNPKCPVGKSIHPVLDGRLDQIQTAMEREMQSITLADIFADTKEYIEDNSHS